MSSRLSIGLSSGKLSCQSAHVSARANVHCTKSICCWLVNGSSWSPTSLPLTRATLTGKAYSCCPRLSSSGVLAFQHLRVAVNFDPQSAVGIVVDGAGEQVAIFAGDSRRHAHFDTVRTANLLAFNRDRHRAAKNNQVVEYPDNTHPDGEDFIFRAVHEAPDPHRDADQIEQHRRYRAGRSPSRHTPLPPARPSR